MFNRPRVLGEKGEEMMELQGISISDKIERPESIGYSVAISNHRGVITSGKIVMIHSDIDKTIKKYLKLKIRLDSESDDIAELVAMTEYSWLPDSDMVKLLIDLKMLPEAGEAILLKKLIGIHVDLVVEALDYEGLLTTSVVAIKRSEGTEIWSNLED